jgi:hypothetical protein
MTRARTATPRTLRDIPPAPPASDPIWLLGLDVVEELHNYLSWAARRRAR